MNMLMMLPEPGDGWLKKILISLGLIGVALALRLLLWPIEMGLQYVTFFPAVALTAVFAGFWPGILTTIIGVILATSIFTYPYMSFSVEVLQNSFWSNVVFSFDGVVVCLSIEAMHRFRRQYAKELEDSKAAHRKSEQSRLQFMAILENVIDGIITFDRTGRVKSFNKAASNIFGYTAGEIVGQDISLLMTESDRHQYEEKLNNFLITDKEKAIEINQEVVGLRKDGSTFPMELAISEVVSTNGYVFCGVVRDISEQKSNEKRMFHMAHHDSLTGLPNRTLLIDRLEQLLIKARRDDAKFAVLFIDLDGFKDINDALGHEYGDLLLNAVTISILDCLRESDTAARMGGDEFVVLLPTVNVEKGALLVAEKIRRSLSQPFLLRDQTVTISSSIGVAFYPEHGLHANELLQHADKAMYQAKRNGRNKVVFYLAETA